MSQRSSVPLDIVFSRACRNFGSTQEQLKEIEGMEVLAVYIPIIMFQEYATQFYRFRKEVKQANCYEAMLGYLLAIMFAETEPEIPTDRGRLPYVFLVEQVLPGHPPGEAPVYSENNPPKIVGYRFMLFYDRVGGPSYGNELDDGMDEEGGGGGGRGGRGGRGRRGGRGGRGGGGGGGGRRTQLTPATILDGSFLVNRKYADEGTVLPGWTNPAYLKNRDDYIQAISIANCIRYDEVKHKSLHDITNIACPNNALSLKKAVNLKQQGFSYNSKQINIAEYQCEIQGEHMYRYKFPEPKRVFRYLPSQIPKFLLYKIPLTVEEENDQIKNLKNTSQYTNTLSYMREIGMINTDNHIANTGEEYETYMNSLEGEESQLSFYNIGSLVSDDQTDANITTQRVVEDMHRHSLGVNTRLNEAQNHEYWHKTISTKRRHLQVVWGEQCENVAKRENVLRALYAHEPHKFDGMTAEDFQKRPLTETEKRELLGCHMAQFWIDCAKDFALIWSKDNDQQSEFKHYAIDWFEKFKTENGGKFMWFVNKTSRNLSLWCDFLCRMMSDLEHVYQCCTTHDKIIVNWFCLMNSSDPDRKRKFNVLNYGPPAKSKSYGLDLIEFQYSIPNVTQSYSRKTKNADTGSGNHDGTCVIMHETQRNLMGYSDYGRRKNPGMASGEEEAMFKDRITSGKMRTGYLVYDEETGARTSRNTVSWLNNTFAFATNDDPAEYSDPIRSRFFLQYIKERKRPGRDPIIMSQLQLSPEEVLIQDKTSEFYRWLHCNVVIVNEMILNGILLPVNTDYSGTMLNMVLKEAGRLGLTDASNIRKMYNVLACVRVAVIVRAVLLAFSSPLSEHAAVATTQTYSLSDHINLQGHLVDTDSSILISILGLLREQYENDLQFDCMRSLTHLVVVNPKWYSEFHQHCDPAAAKEIIEQRRRQALKEDATFIKRNKARAAGAPPAGAAPPAPPSINSSKEGAGSRATTGVPSNGGVGGGTPTGGAPVLRSAYEFDEDEEKTSSLAHQRNRDEDSSEEESSRARSKRGKGRKRRQREPSEEREEKRAAPAKHSAMDLGFIQEDIFDDSEEYWNKTVAVTDPVTKQTIHITRDELLLYAPRDEQRSNYLKIKLPFVRPRKQDGQSAAEFDDFQSARDIGKQIYPMLSEKPQSHDVNSTFIMLLQSVWQPPSLSLNEKEAEEEKYNEEGEPNISMGLEDDDDEKDDKLERPFQLKGNVLYVRRELIRHNSKAKLETAIRRVFENSVAVPGDYLFGARHSRHVFNQFNVIHIGRDLNNPPVITNPRFVSPKVLEVLKVYRSDLYRNSPPPSTLLENDSSADTQSVSHFVGDIDFALTVWSQHMDNIGWEFARIQKTNAFPERITHKLLCDIQDAKVDAWKSQKTKAQAEGNLAASRYLEQNPVRELAMYPDYMVSDVGEVIERNFLQERNTEEGKIKYSLKHQLAKRLKRLNETSAFAEGLVQGDASIAQLNVKDLAATLVQQTLSLHMSKSAAKAPVVVANKHTHFMPPLEPSSSANTSASRASIQPAPSPILHAPLQPQRSRSRASHVELDL
jgi:hypothetical protein